MTADQFKNFLAKTADYSAQTILSVAMVIACPKITDKANGRAMLVLGSILACAGLTENVSMAV